MRQILVVWKGEIIANKLMRRVWRREEGGSAQMETGASRVQLYLRPCPSLLLVEGLRGLGALANAGRMELLLKSHPSPVLAEGLRELRRVRMLKLLTASSSLRVSSSTGSMGPVPRLAQVTCRSLASVRLPALKLPATIRWLGVAQRGSKLEARGPRDSFRKPCVATSRRQQRQAILQWAMIVATSHS